jgi:hypothetical protein
VPAASMLVVLRRQYGAMSGMSLNGVSGGLGMGPVIFHPQSTAPQQPQQAMTTPAFGPPSSESGTDRFADLAGLF